MLQHQKHRLPRFRCDPGRVQPIKLTRRDQQILEVIHRHRFLRSSHVISLVDGSSQQILRRLQRLFHHGYVTRPRCQLDFFHIGGSTPIIYGISTKGFRMLHACGPDIDAKHSGIDWTSKNNSVQQLYLHHTLLISDIMIAMEKCFRGHPWIRFIPQEQLFRDRSSSIRWRVTSFSGKPSSIQPDAVFALENLTASGDRKRCHYFVEADTGTMPIERKLSADASSFGRKLELYSETWRQKVHETELGIQRFQMLTITISPKRAKQIANVAGKIKRGGGIFLITDRDSLLKSAQCNAILEHPWLTFQAEVEDTLRP